MKTVLYQKTRLNKVQQWTIWVEKNGKSGYPEVWTEFGILNGKMQTTFDVIKEGVNVGKANETSPLQQAILTAERKITKQKEEGYRETLEDKSSDIDFSVRLPKELCFYKPKNSLPDAKLASLEKAKQAIFTRKRDGQMSIVRHSDTFGVEIYSRRMDLTTNNYPHLVESLACLKGDCILLGEMVLDTNGKDDFKSVSSICRSDPVVAIEKQKTLGLIKYYIFDLAFFNEKNLLTSKTFMERRAILDKQIMPYVGNNVEACQIIDTTHENAMKLAKKNGWEGLVVWDAKGRMKDGEAFTMNGKAYRPNCIYKSKPLFESDFIIRWDPANDIGEYGKGKNGERVGSVFIYQLLNDEEVFLGKCGGGLSELQREFYTTATYPRVWRIEYSAVQPKTGKLRFPVFNADRTIIGDKNISECDMSNDIINAREDDDEEGEEE